MRRFDKLQSILMNVPGRFAAVMAVLLLAVWPMTAPGQAQPQKKAPARGAQSHAAPGSPATAKKRSAEKPKSDPDMAWLQDAMKDPEFMNAVGHLSQRLVNELQFPAARTQSRILPRLSGPVAFYFAFSNYGQTLHQAQEIFQQELRGSPALQNFLHKNKLDVDEPKLEEELQKIYEITQYLGDEVVITGTMNGEKPNIVMVAEVKKPGLKTFLEQTYQQLQKTVAKPPRIFDPEQLAAFQGGEQEGGLLIRPDFIIGSDSIATLRKFSSQLDTGGSQPFMATPLGKKLSQSYQNGAFSVMAMNLQPFLDLIPQNPPQTRLMLEKTGFADMNYLLAASTMEGKDAVNQVELDFQGPRHGVASWIVGPVPVGGLAFLFPQSVVAEAIRLKSPARIFDDIVELAGPDALAMLPQMEAQMNVNLKQDILSKLGGEIAFELQNPPDMGAGTSSGHATAEPNFKVVLSVSDPAGLQKTLKRLLATAPMESGERVEDGVTFYTLSPPSANGASTEFNYFFLDGYLVVTSNHALAQETVRLHRGGESLARSSDIVAHGRPVKASALAYQNTGSFLTSLIKQMPPGTEGLQLWKALGVAGESKPTLFLGYADETSVRGVSGNSVATNASLGLIVAAIAIPNLLRSRMAANEATAASVLRTVTTAQVTYSTSYPGKGYAPSLATLGPGENGDCSESNVSAAHACLLDNVVGNPSCMTGKWCTKNGYRFSMRGACTQARCSSYVVTATPENEGSGGKSFCTTTDAIIRQQTGAPLTAPLTAAECKAWKPIM